MLDFDRISIQRWKNLILTRFAVIGVDLTLEASVARLAQALVTAHCVVTNGGVAAWVFHTLVDVDLTRLTLKGKREKVKSNIQCSVYGDWQKQGGSAGGYLAILRGRCRKSSGSLLPLYTLHHFYRVWGCRVQVRSRSCHLGENTHTESKLLMFPKM